jgi:hypothetical protein
MNSYLHTFKVQSWMADWPSSQGLSIAEVMKRGFQVKRSMADHMLSGSLIWVQIGRQVLRPLQLVTQAAVCEERGGEGSC